MDRTRKPPLCLGIVAHVDAGKTTLSESILYLTGAIRKPGRVDHQDTFLDTDAMEKARGITIFSKQAEFSIRDRAVTLLDTPGHVDFSAEMERTLGVLDYAVLVISGADGVQGHTVTLWHLLERYNVPTFLFINKMDQPGTDREALMAELKKRLSDGCIDFGREEAKLHEDLAVYEEALMEKFLDGESLTAQEVQRLIAERHVFPCYFGSALKIFGVQELLDGLHDFTRVQEYPETFGAKVYKITHDVRNQRLTHMKITGGSLKVREDLSGPGWTEKVNQILIESGDGSTQVDQVSAGQVCMVTGLTQTYAGEGLGMEPEGARPVLEPVLNYQIRILPDGTGHVADPHTMLTRLKELEEEDPQLHIVWDEELQEIHAQLMGEIEIEILRDRIYERFKVPVAFDAGRLIYKETIAAPVEGIGHFEPLRHYAEVHLLLEPAPRGSGLTFDSRCSEDVLSRNWQRLILTHLQEKQHRGVLTGSVITDMHISLLTGRAHLKHTEGGDFRQATYRAVRQGLKKAQSILLEPIYAFRLEIPAESIGRALSDVTRMFGEVLDQEITGDRAILTGRAPVATMREYQKEVTAYSHGSGRIFCTLDGYTPCHNTEEVVASRGYDSEEDLANPTGSVFCAHGAGFLVPWDQVEAYMHLEGMDFREEPAQPAPAVRRAATANISLADEEELTAIFERTYGKIERERNRFNRNRAREALEAEQARHYRSPFAAVQRNEKEKYLLVDGYNIVFAWEELEDLAKISLDAARTELMDVLSNYQGYTEEHLILVFDAYKVKDNPGEYMKYDGIDVVFTREAQTADQYIEQVVHEIGRKYAVTVATSDALEQLIIWGEGARRMSARELKEEVEAVNIKIRETYESRNSKEKNRPLERILKDGKREEKS